MALLPWMGNEGRVGSEFSRQSSRPGPTPDGQSAPRGWPAVPDGGRARRHTRTAGSTRPLRRARALTPVLRSIAVDVIDRAGGSVAVRFNWRNNFASQMVEQAAGANAHLFTQRAQ